MSYQDKLKPIASPVTQAGYASKLKPIAAAPAQPKGDGFLKTLIKDPIKTLLVKPAFRTTEAAGRLGLFGSNIKSGFEAMADSGESQRVLGMDIEPVKAFGQGGGKQIVGEGLQSLSYLYGGGAAKKGVQTIGTAARGGAVPTVRQAAVQTAKVGGVSGGAYGAGEEMTKTESTLGSILKGGAVGGALGTVTGGALGAATPAIVKALSPAQRRAASAVESEKALTRVLGSKSTPRDLETAGRAFREVDFADLTNNADAEKRMTEAIADIATLQDKAYATDPTRRTLSNLVQRTDVNGEIVPTNFVDEGITELEKHYTKAGPSTAVIEMRQLRQKAIDQGLTAEEINQLARRHGRDLSVFDKNTSKGPTGALKQKVEGTRSGIKDTVRGAFGNKITKEADSAMSDLKRVQSLFRQKALAVHTYKSSLVDPGILKRAAGLIEQALNIATGGLSRMVGEVVRKSANLQGASDRLNVLDLEKRLKEDLGIFGKSGAGDSEATVIKKLQDFITAAGEKPVLLLDAPKPRSNTLFGTKAGKLTESAQEASDMAAVEAGKAKVPSQMDERTYRRKVTEIQTRLEQYLTPEEMGTIQMGSGKPLNRGPQLPTAVGAPNVYTNPTQLNAALQRKLERYLSPEEMEIIQMGPPARAPLFKGPTIKF